MTWDRVAEIGLFVLIVTGFVGGLTLAFNTITTGNPLKFPSPLPNGPCGEGIHVTHNGQPIANLAIKQLGSGTHTWGATNSTGYLILSICSPVGTIVTFQATDYGFQLEPYQIVEAAI